MSDKQISNVGSTDAKIDVETIQRGWDSFAVRDPTVDPTSGEVPQNFTPRNSIIAAEVFGSRRVYGSPMEFGDTFARADSSDYAVEDAPDDRGGL